MTNKQQLTVYVLSRTDMPSLNAGKAMSQSHHAGVQMIAKFAKSKLVRDYVSTGTAEGADHFNTTVVLGANLAQINLICKLASKLDNIEYGTVIDPSYPFYVDNDELANLMQGVQYIGLLNNGKILLTRKELTCAWFLGDRNREDFKSLFAELSLHP